MFSDVVNFLRDFLYNCKLGNLLTTIFENNVTTDVSLITGGNLYQTGIDLFFMLAIGISFTYLIIYFINGLLDEKVNREFIVRIILRFAAVCLLIKYGPYIIALILDSSNDLISKISESYSISTKGNSYVGAEEILGGLMSLISFILMFIPNLIIIIIAVISLNIVIYRRYIQMGIYTVGFCLVVPDIIMNGVHSSTVGYIKKICALALQGVIIMLIVKCCGVFFNQSGLESLLNGATIFVTLTGLGTIPAMIVSSIIAFIRDGAVVCMMISMLFRSEQIAKDIIGAK